MKMQLLLMVLFAGVLLSGCNKSEQKPAAKQKEEPNYSSGNPVTAPVDYLGAVGKAKTTAVKQVDLASVKQAIQMYQTEEGHFPKDLGELVSQKYLPAIPAAPYGMKYVYNPTNGQVGIIRAQ